MNTQLVNSPWRVLLATAFATAVTGAVAMSASDAPRTRASAPAPAASVPAPSDTDLDAQLAAAQKRLEQAAKEVARLSTQISGTMIDHFMPFESSHAIIGVQLEPAAGAAGARVRELSPGGPAAEAGIKVGDVIVAVDGTEVKGAQPARQVLKIMRSVTPDSKVSLRVLRDGAARDFTVTARGGPGAMGALHGMPEMDFDFSGFDGNYMFHGALTDMELATLTPRLGGYFGSDKGVLVVRAPTGGALKLEDGDVILAIDGREPTSGSHATRILRSYQPGEKLTLRIIRQHKTQDLEATLPERNAWPHENMMYRVVPEPHQVPTPPKIVVFGSAIV